ncbi:hypothetical protein [Tautonia sociabilis]|uniref:HEAT repeat domain-containing protein n=1 Tax=Tautonia sociabilis TaxID=2080755 RepID=A0A432MHY5_9BACT|nr:hypothetical protein [Tautonia sociabilis]RUL86752.1 hypothetical protein TsocGM_15740 [Tautonia sociabilis]
MADPSPPGPNRPELPSLPIVSLEPWEQRSRLERYGGFHYLAIGGLVLLVGMIGWFVWGVWSLREVWRDVYVLHDPSRPAADRILAADRLSRNPDVTQRQLYDISLRRDLPDPARYLVAEALTAEATKDDPRAFALAVARSEGWPDWLRLLHLRPLAYASGEGGAIEQEPLRELARHPDPVIRLWATYTLAQSSRSHRAERETLRALAQDGPHPDLAALLLRALEAEDDRGRNAALDEATSWIREHHPGASSVWSGWEQAGSGNRPSSPEEAAPGTSSDAEGA